MLVCTRSWGLLNIRDLAKVFLEEDPNTRLLTRLLLTYSKIAFATSESSRITSVIEICMKTYELLYVCSKTCSQLKWKKIIFIIPLFVHNILGTEQKADLDHHYLSLFHSLHLQFTQKAFKISDVRYKEYKFGVMITKKSRRYLRFEFLTRTWTRIMNRL